jgi:uncharacterized protein YacL
MPPPKQPSDPAGERRAVRERRRTPRVRAGTDLLHVRLAQLLAVLTGVFIGFFIAYLISYAFISPMEELENKARQAIVDAQKGLELIEPQYIRLRKEAQLIEGGTLPDNEDEVLEPAPAQSASSTPGAAPTQPGTTGGEAAGAEPAAGNASPEPQPPAATPAAPHRTGTKLRSTPRYTAEQESTLRQYASITRQKKSFESQVATRTDEIKEYSRNITALNYLSFAVLVILGMVGYLLYPLYLKLLVRSTEQWGVIFAQRGLRTAPLLIGFFMGMILAVVVLLGLFTTVSTQYTFLSLPPFRLLFGAFVTIALGFGGSLVGASYFSPPPPEEDPYKEYRRPAAPSLLDSSVLIDGRVYEVAANGFITGVLIVPTSVLDELQALADSGDERKRGKGKRGLDMVNKMKGDPRLDLQIFDDSSFDRHGRGADEHLIRVAQAMGGQVVTNDYNLNRVASARDVRVINLNALANAVKTNHVPGDFIEIDIADRGKQRGQGVGYLPDGTMVVIEDGEPYIGKAKTIKLTSISQTQAGRLLFGRVDAAEGELGNGRVNGGHGNGGGGR